MNINTRKGNLSRHNKYKHAPRKRTTQSQLVLIVEDCALHTGHAYNYSPAFWTQNVPEVKKPESCGPLSELSGFFNELSGPFNELSGFLGEHSGSWDQHSGSLSEHSGFLSEHSGS